MREMWKILVMQVFSTYLKYTYILLGSLLKRFFYAHNERRKNNDNEGSIT